MTGADQVILIEGGGIVSKSHVLGVLKALVRLNCERPAVLQRLAFGCRQEIPAIREGDTWTLTRFGLIQVDGLICGLVVHIMRFCTRLDDERILFRLPYQQVG